MFFTFHVLEVGGLRAFPYSKPGIRYAEPSGCNCSLAKVEMTSFGSSRALPSSLATT